MSGLSSAKPTATAVKRTCAEGVRKKVHAAASGRKICAGQREGLNGKAKPWRESLVTP